MAVPSFTLTHPSVNGGVAVSVLCDIVTVSGKRNLEDTPNANTGSQVDVQVTSHENLKYIVQGIRATGTANTLTYAHLLAMYRSTQPATLTLVYGKNGSNTLVGFDGSDTTISVVLEQFTFPINVRDSVAGYLPIFQATFIETA